MPASRIFAKVPLLVVCALLLLATACATPSSTVRTTARPTHTAHPSAPAASSALAPAGGYLGLVKMGMPTAPQPFMSDEIAISKHAHAIDGSYYPPAERLGQPVTADHGADCGPPPATHHYDGSYANAVFVCHDHLMTVANATGTTVISMQPDQLVDFTNGPATAGVSVSTFRTSNRDWIDLYFMPWQEQTAYTNDGNTGEEPNAPKDFIRVRLDTSADDFTITEGVHGVQQDLPSSGKSLLDTVKAVSKATRTPLSVTLSKTHIVLVANGVTIDSLDLPMTFPVSQVIFQVEHVNYNPSSFIPESTTPEQAALGLEATANTWHWSNLSISKAVPYYQQMAMPDAVGDAGAYDDVPGLGNTISFAAAPAGSYLRFAADDHTYGNFASFAISFDGGKTWRPLARNDVSDDTFYGSFFQPIPQGATSAILRGTDHWYARDFYVMSLAAHNAPPVRTAGTPMATP